MQDILQRAKELSFRKINSKLPEYKRFLFDEIKNSTSKIIGIYGSRGVGKTTLILQILKELTIDKNKILYISLDHPIFANVNLFEFVEYFYKLGGEVVAIDEVHEYKEFERDLKSIYDFLDIKVFFSGSSALKITNPSFVRRFSMFHLPILSLREFLEITYGIKLSNLSLSDVLNHRYVDVLSNEFKILEEFHKFLKVGNYAFYFEDKEKYQDRIIETINTILYVDLVSVDEISPEKIDSLKKLLINICFSKPVELSMEKLAKNSGITKKSLYKYLDALNRAELINRVMNEAKRFSNIKKPDKLYLANTNLLFSLCSNPEIGNARETFFVSFIKEKYEIYFANAGDFLVEDKYVFEIGGKNKTDKQIKNLKSAFLVKDDIEIGSENIIPLWAFGFLY